MAAAFDIGDLEKALSIADQVVDRANNTLKSFEELLGTVETLRTRSDTHRAKILLPNLVLKCRLLFQASKIITRELAKKYREFIPPVEAQYQKYITNLENFTTSLYRLRVIALNPHLHRDKPDVTNTLFDFVPLDEVQTMLKEAVSEASANSKLARYLRVQALKAEKKLTYFEDLEKNIEASYENFLRFKPEEFEAKLPEFERNRMECQKLVLALSTQRDRIEFNMKTFYESKLNRTVVNPDAYFPLARPAADMVSYFAEEDAKITSHFEPVLRDLEVLCTMLSKTSSIFNEIEEITELLSLFNNECRAKYTNLAEIKKDHEEHREGYANLFTQMEVYSHYFGKFLDSYDPVLEEISRRKKEHDKIVAMVQDFQQKLGAILQLEASRRERFQAEYGQYIPSGFSPQLEEDLVRITITGDFNTTLFELPSDIAASRSALKTSNLVKVDPKDFSTLITASNERPDRKSVV